MLFKVNPSKQNIQTEQGALTGSRYVQLHAPLQRRWKVLISNRKKKQDGGDFGGGFKPSISTRIPLKKRETDSERDP